MNERVLPVLLGKQTMQRFWRGTKILVGLVNDQGNPRGLRKFIEAFDNFWGIDRPRRIVGRAQNDCFSVVINQGGRLLGQGDRRASCRERV